MDKIIISMSTEARELIAGICYELARELIAGIYYELATHNDILKAMSEEQMDVMCAVFGKIIYENIELPEEEDEHN